MVSTEDLAWRKPRRCDTNACVETATTPEHVYVRNSTEPEGPILQFTRQEWAVFVSDIRDEPHAA